jgi:glucan phosphoethanolaminetransferase (alkaline phosphatase superfamily)
MNIQKLIRPVAFGIVFLLVFIFLINVFSENIDSTTSLKDAKSVNFGFNLTFALVAIAVASILVLVIVGLKNKPMSALVSLGGLVLLGILFAIGYASDAGELVPSYTKGEIITTETASKLVGGVLNATLYVLIAAVIFSFVTSIRDLINKI